MPNPSHESEWRTRKKRIDPKLKALGWTLVPFDETADLSKYRHSQFSAGRSRASLSKPKPTWPAARAATTNRPPCCWSESPPSGPGATTEGKLNDRGHEVRLDQRAVLRCKAEFLRSPGRRAFLVRPGQSIIALGKPEPAPLTGGGLVAVGRWAFHNQPEFGLGLHRPGGRAPAHGAATWPV